MNLWDFSSAAMRAWWQKTAPAPAAQTPVAIREPAAASRVPSEYQSLFTYLDKRYASNVVLTFGQMEALLGFPLPERATTEPDWWTAAPVREDAHAGAWTMAHRTASPNLAARIVAFERLP